MRTIGAVPVTARYIGQRHVIGRYVGARQIFVDFILRGLIHHFDGRNNVGSGVHDPNADEWVDLVTGATATMQDVSWLDFGVRFANPTSKVFYQGQSVDNYTIFNTHKVEDYQGLHPRLFGEAPYPTLYLHSTVNYAYALFGQGKDAFFVPQTVPPIGTLIFTAMRFGSTGVVDLFCNGVLTASLSNVLLDPAPVPTMYIGCRAANDRAFRGEIYEHLVYNRALSDQEIYHNFLVSNHRYQL